MVNLSTMCDKIARGEKGVIATFAREGDKLLDDFIISVYIKDNIFYCRTAFYNEEVIALHSRNEYCSYVE